MKIETLKVINELQKEVHENAISHGFYDRIESITNYLNENDQPAIAEEVQMNFVLAQLAKIASEIGEAVEAIQKNKPVAEYAEELADIFIRLLDLAEWQGISLAVSVVEKMRKNALRPYLHGKRC